MSNTKKPWEHPREAVWYEKYIASTEWRRKRERRLEIDNRMCRTCGIKASDNVRLHVHHKPTAYEKVPNESVEDDLTTLCWACHQAIERVLDHTYYGIANKQTSSEYVDVTKGLPAFQPIASVQRASDEYLASPSRSRIHRRDVYKKIDRPQLTVDQQNNLCGVEITFGPGYEVSVDTAIFGELVLMIADGHSGFIVDMDRFSSWLSRKAESSFVWPVDDMYEEIKNLGENEHK